MELYDVVKKLVGNINPVAETNQDSASLKNLQALCLLVDKLIYDVDYIARAYGNRHECSVKLISTEARRFLKELSITLAEEYSAEGKEGK